jgi:hypothetical protein
LTVGRGLSDLQTWLLTRTSRPFSGGELAREFYGETTPAARTAVSRAIRRLRQRGLLPLTVSDPRWSLTVNERCRIGQADVFDFFASLPADSNDLVFGSGPYENARLYLENGVDLGISRNTDEWVKWMVEVYKAALRSCRGLVAFVVGNGRTRNYRWSGAPSRLETALLDAGICLREPPIFERVGIPGGGGNKMQHAENGGSADWLRGYYEKIICATRGGKLPWGDTLAMGHPPKFKPGGNPSHRTQDGSRVGRGTRGYRDGDIVTAKGYKPPEKANPGNVVRCNVGGGRMGDELCHENEAPFPEELAEFFVRSFCPPGGLVCDPFVGSGTTAKVALRWGRRFIGCDLRASQVALSQQRLGMQNGTHRIAPGASECPEPADPSSAVEDAL